MSKLRESTEFNDDCISCMHQFVCHGDRSKTCINYEFKTGEFGYLGCVSCTHHPDRQKGIPCFRCRYYKEERR